MKPKYPVLILIIILLLSEAVSAQYQDLTAICSRSDETVSHLLFTKNESEFSMNEAFRARNADLNENHSHLTVTGDFTGDGLDEVAFFDDMLYTPNMNPDFTSSAVWVSRSMGAHFLSSGNWFSVPRPELGFQHVDFTVAGDYNLDGFCDIALFYNDRGSELLTIYVLQSDGAGFSDPIPWYSCDRSEFNFTALRSATPGDFNGNGHPDIAVFYDYFGSAPETRQSVFLFESNGDTLSLLPVAYDGTKASYDFSEMVFASGGDYNLDGYTDIAVLHEDAFDQDLLITVFEGSDAGTICPLEYASFVDTGPELSQVIQAPGGNYAGDRATDLALFYDNPGTGNLEILVLESEHSSFKAPSLAFSSDPGSLTLADLKAVRTGSYFYEPLVSVATWKGDRRGALSFTFDDGYKGAFEHGGAELDAAGLKGTYYIFTDTSIIYDGELASTSLVRSYKEKGHEIASHTVNHSNLGRLTETGDLDSLAEVLSGSVELLNERFNQYTMTMSIPFGSFRYETLGHLAKYFYSARSSKHGFNLATPFDNYALKSWPILSTTSPAYVDNLFSITEKFGTYLPLMYHDMLDEPFDEDALKYTYSRDLFRETVQDAINRDLWIDTHAAVYKYIRQRNALKILHVDTTGIDSQPAFFSFEADDDLADSLFNVELTLKIALPGRWTQDTLSIGPEGQLEPKVVQEDSTGSFVLYNWLPASGVSISVYEGNYKGAGTGILQPTAYKTSLHAAPNPFHHETIITVSGRTAGSEYLIVRDIHGRIVREIREYAGTSFRLSRAELPPGIYFVQLLDAGKQLGALKLLIH